MKRKNLRTTSVLIFLAILISVIYVASRNGEQGAAIDQYAAGEPALALEFSTASFGTLMTELAPASRGTRLSMVSSGVLRDHWLQDSEAEDGCRAPSLSSSL